MKSFPFLTNEETKLLSGFFCETLDEEEALKVEQLKREDGFVSALLDSLEAEFEAWRQDGRSGEFSRVLLEGIRRQRHFGKLRDAWRRLESLAGRLREEAEIVLGAFAPAEFQTASRFLGEDKGEEFSLPEVVRPFLGKAWEIDRFEVAVPPSVADPEFEVRDPSGEVVLCRRVAPGEKAEFPFSQLGVDRGGLWSWCLSYSEAGEMKARSGKVSVLDPEERSRVETLLSFAGREASENASCLMKALILIEFDCFDGAVRVLAEAVRGDGGGDAEFQREILLLLHRVYGKVRGEYLSLGFMDEANEVLKAVFAVEKALEKLSEGAPPTSEGTMR